MYSVSTRTSRSLGIDGGEADRPNAVARYVSGCFRFYAGGCMYSLVLMMAMTSPADDVAFGRRGNCHGGEAYACTGGGYGSSCHGGGRGGLFHKHAHACHGGEAYAGCNGGGCHGGGRGGLFHKHAHACHGGGGCCGTA